MKGALWKSPYYLPEHKTHIECLHSRAQIRLNLHLWLEHQVGPNKESGFPSLMLT